MTLQNLHRIFHTVRHLRPVQLTDRVRRRIFRPRFTPTPAPPLRQPERPWIATPARPALLRANGRLQIFQDEYAVASAADWNRPELPALVTYNLHYFDDLTAADGPQRRAAQTDLIRRWIDQNPLGVGAGWEPYPLSLRIVNWIKWQLSGGQLTEQARQSLATQTAALAEQLEFHLLGNHLLANAKGLVFAGCYFDGSLATGWLERGLEILRTELPEQILADGGHFELSPMYHSLILEDLMDLWNLQQSFPRVNLARRLPGLADRIAQMRRWLVTMCHPDGQISFFNDAALGVAIAPQSLAEYADRLSLPPVPSPVDGLTHLDHSGYIRLQRADSVVLLDVAEVGPTYQPGHAHADTLSFEWSYRGQRVVVNSGTSCYGTTAERARQRSTAAHSTVAVDNEDSSEVWSSFRVARRARPIDLRLHAVGDTLDVCCSHDGYRRLPGRVIHQRRWTLGDTSFEIDDQLSGRFRAATARNYLHPAVSLAMNGLAGQLHVADQVMPFEVTGGQPRCVSTTFHPEFGISQANNCIESCFHGLAHQLRYHW